MSTLNLKAVTSGYTISLYLLCIHRVNQISPMRGKMPRLRTKRMKWLERHMHCYSNEMVLVAASDLYFLLTTAFRF